jgi:hypothetical protein
MWSIYQACRAQLELHQVEEPHQLQTNVMHSMVRMISQRRIKTTYNSDVTSPKVETMLAITCMMHKVWSTCITRAASQSSP